MSLQYAILGLLDSFGTMSGYDIKQRFTESVNNIWEADLSQIYRTLDRLESNELVNSIPDPSSSRGRKIYTITEQGIADLREWVQQDLILETVRNPALLQIFFARHTPPERFRQQILDYRQKFTEIGTHYEQIESMLTELIECGWEDGFYQHLTLLLGKKYVQMTIEWCDEVLERFEKHITGDEDNG